MRRITSPSALEPRDEGVVLICQDRTVRRPDERQHFEMVVVAEDWQIGPFHSQRLRAFLDLAQEPLAKGHGRLPLRGKCSIFVLDRSDLSRLAPERLQTHQSAMDEDRQRKIVHVDICVLRIRRNSGTIRSFAANRSPSADRASAVSLRPQATRPASSASGLRFGVSVSGFGDEKTEARAQIALELRSQALGRLSEKRL